jgi:hypothetical protein
VLGTIVQLAIQKFSNCVSAFRQAALKELKPQFLKCIALSVAGKALLVFDL